MQAAAAALDMANKLLCTEETESWCDDIPDGSVVDSGDIL
jgi:hypothetical protein